MYYMNVNGGLPMENDLLVVAVSMFTTLTSYWMLQVFYFINTTSKSTKEDTQESTKQDTQDIGYVIVSLVIKSIVMSLTLSNVHKHSHDEILH